MMIALPIRIGGLGASRQTIHPMIVAQSSIVYWNGASTAVGVIASARVKQTKHSIARDGCSAITTPTKPTATANQRNDSTFSPSSGTDNAVMISGEAM